MTKDSTLSFKTLFYISLGLIIYMPLHVLIVQWFSLATGSIEIWKAAKDVLLFSGSPILLYLSWRRGLFKDKNFRILFALGAVYALIHGLFLLLDNDDHNLSAVAGTVFNTRLLAYLLLGYLVGSAKNGQLYLKYLLTTSIIIASLVALFGVAQYFLPHDLLTHAGYTLERGVKPLFFIDDKPDLPRVMSTLKDPNSLGAYLILPIILSGLAFTKNKFNKELFVRPFRRSVLAAMLITQLGALFLTFSRGALLAFFLSVFVAFILVSRQRIGRLIKKFSIPLLIVVVAGSFVAFSARDSYIFQNVVLHADESTVLADPNELRVQLAQEALDDVLEDPIGHGPGSAGLVSISNPQGGVLTENYYLQIAYEVGWLGLLLFVVILSIIMYQLSVIGRKNPAAIVLFSAGVGYIFYSFLIHLWSNEAVALQWWLLTGTFLGTRAMFGE